LSEQEALEGALVWLFKLIYFLHNQLEARSSPNDIKQAWMDGGA
jgi:hypothetical protein